MRLLLTEDAAAMSLQMLWVRLACYQRAQQGPTQQHQQRQLSCLGGAMAWTAVVTVITVVITVLGHL
jgi:hypothetical protein